MKDIHNTWAHRWVSPKVKSYKSHLHGLGVIAVKSISKGEPIALLGGVIVPTSEIYDYQKIMGDVGIQIDDDFFIVPTKRKELEEKGVFNHSCDPNCGFDGSIKLIAIRNIDIGEELCFDYAFSESFTQSFKCNCNSSNCRKNITNEDWKNLEIQKKYGEYFSPYLKKKFLNIR